MDEKRFKSGKIVAVVALITSIIAIGWLGYDNFLAPKPSSSREYFIYENDSYIVSGMVEIDNSDLNITINLNPGEKVYMLYTTMVYIQDTGSGTNGVSFAFKIDNITIFEPFIKTRLVDATGQFGACLQFTNTSMSSGYHVISVYGKGNSVSTDAIVFNQALNVRIFS